MLRTAGSQPLLEDAGRSKILGCHLLLLLLASTHILDPNNNRAVVANRNWGLRPSWCGNSTYRYLAFLAWPGISIL